MGRHDEGFFSAKDNLRLFWECDLPEAPRAHIGIVHGYADHCGRYRKTIDMLVGEGFAVHAFDYRGHGQADGRRGYCDAFEDFVDDLELFWNRVRAAAAGKKAFLLGHSHGGLMALHLLKRRPADLTGLLLSGPYLKLALKPPALKVFASIAIGKVIPWLQVKNELTPKDLSRDPEAQKATEKDPLYNTTVTPRWFTESNRAQEQAREMGSQVNLPLYMFCGGADGVASTPSAKAFFDTVASADKTYREYPGMLHETLNEVGHEQVWKDMSGWISAHS
ncbi:MAG: alpha/beta hydrolase [Myxococcaceae bacterium]